VIVGSMALMGHLVNAKASETDKSQDNTRP
jgi:hypothetical protein